MISQANKPPSRPAEDQPTEVGNRLRAAIGKLGRGLRPTVAGSDLTPSQTSVLFAVVRQGPLGLSELAEIESLNPTMLSRITAGLCDRGLLDRQTDPGDRRAAVVRATSDGKRMRKRIHTERARALSAYLDELTSHEYQSLMEALPVLETLADQMRGRQA
jgi:DNA-binding MarR family transcriptional regulator